jgi:long-chain acyl-CoA synthetase
MARRTLIDFFDDLSTIDASFVVHDDGYRTWSYSYKEIVAAAREFASQLRANGITSEQKVVLWCENRPEWLVVLWGCLLEGVILVPIDYRGSAELMLRVADIVDAKAIVGGDVVPQFETSRRVWKIGEVAAVSGRLKPASTDEQAPSPQPPAPNPDTVAEIIFTSGATADPKGVVITHRNILANMIPIEREIAKYQKYARPFKPLRFLNLLPLSHMFGQSMATFIPPMLTGEVVYMRSYAPQDIVRQVHDRRISVLVCVPKILEVLREYVRGRHEGRLKTAPNGSMHWLKRWWIYRDIHRMFGFKFWAFVVGAAPLDPELEAFWGQLGFVVIQGYGLTETAPVVTLNHPFHAAKGAVGKPIAGVEVKIADDGEILVRGENVTRGYFNAPEDTKTAFEDGWFHTGDIGELDATGHLRIRGRKKEMIVTPEGLNVFPEDVERVLNAIPGVRDSAVVGAPTGGSSSERVQAVLVLDAGIDVDSVVRSANTSLLDHQKIRAATVWTTGDLPRTEGTRKLKRRELKQWLASSSVPEAARRAPDGTRSVEAVVSRFAPSRTIASATTIDELGLSSLERVELMLALEEAFQVTVDEQAFAAAKTVGDLGALVTVDARLARTDAATTARDDIIDFPSWNRSAPARILRTASLPTWILPLARVFMSLDVRGLEHLKDIRGPVVFAANHQSHFDTPAILKALPARWRYNVAPAMAKEFFKAHFFPAQFGRKAYMLNSLNYYLASLFFNAFPLPQRETGTRQTLRYVGELLAAGQSVLIFPEGKRTNQGEINSFQPGVGMLASRLNVPVVPVRLEGLDRILHHSWKFPSRGRGRVTFGAPMSLTGNDYKDLARRIEEAVKQLSL